jgi:lipopolysaccharide transport system ATP-binding protein
VGKSYRRYRREWHRLLAWAGFSGVGWEENWVLRHVSFSLKRGEAVGIMGQNGAGKSTLLKLITGTMRASEGGIEVFGSVSALLELGLGFNPELTGRQNAYHSAGLMGRSREEIDLVIDQIESFAEVGAYFDQPLRTYSSGMQVRVAFATATAFRPEILIVDEALSVGDARFQHKCFDRIRQFRAQGTTLLFVSHDLAAILSICDRAVLLDRGQLIMEGAPQDVYDVYHSVMIERGKASTVEQKPIGRDRTQLIYGTREAEVTGVTLIDSAGNAVEMVEVGQSVTLVIRAIVREPIAQLVAAYVISDRLGNYVFGMNTHDWKRVVGDLRPGETVEYRFAFPANLGAGSYSITTALLRTNSLIDDNYEWRGPALLFEVVNVAEAKFIGCSWIKPEITINRDRASSAPTPGEPEPRSGSVEEAVKTEGDIDVVVRREFFPGETHGIMIEIGAARPDFLSIGASFRAAGWRVVSIEPNPEFARMHRELGHEIYEFACSDVDADGVDFMVARGNLPYLDGTVTAESFSSLAVRGKYKELLSTLSDRFDLRQIKVNVRRLDTILSDLNGIGHVDILAVDVEGWELECLRGFSFGPLAPKVAIIENLFHDPVYREFMEARGYVLWRVYEPNDVYVLRSMIESRSSATE